MKTFRYVSFAFIVSAAIAILPYSSVAANLSSIKTEMNRAIFYGIGSISNPQIQQNSEKTQLLFTLNGVTVAEKAHAAFGKGMMNDIDVVYEKGLTKIFIQLKEKQGFTVSHLPYSDAWCIDVFDWDKLSAHDDMYRGAQLALQDGLAQLALQNLRTVAEKGHSDAAAFLGVELIKQGLYDEALGWLKKAIRGNTTIADAYGGLCQIARVNGMSDEAKSYEKRFCDITGLRSVLDIPVQYQPPLATINDNNNEEEPLSIAAIMVDEDNLHDSTSYAATKDTSRFSSLFATNTTDQNSGDANKEVINASLMPQWMKTVSIAAIAVLLSAVIAMVVMYIRWRKRKQEAIEMDEEDENSIPETSLFAAELQQAQSQTPTASLQSAAKSYANTFEKTIDDTSENENNISTVPLAKNVSQEKTMLEEFIGEVITMSKNAVDKGKNYVEERKQSLVEGVFSPEDNDDNLWHEDSIIVPQRGEYELAMNLQAKQRIQRSQSLGTLDADMLPSQQFGITKVARKLGIETGSIEAKRSISHLQTDAHALSDLRKKFSKQSSVHFAS